MSHVRFSGLINVQFVVQPVLKVCLFFVINSNRIQRFSSLLAHTIKYCQATGDDNNQHIPTPYEKMIRTQCMQSFGFDDNFTSTLPTLFDPLAASPSSLYTNGWSNSYL